MNRKEVIKKFFYILLIIFSTFIFSLVFHLKKYFNSTYLEQLLYNLFNTTTLKLVSLKNSYVQIFLLTFIISCIIFIFLLVRVNFDIKIGKMRLKIFPINIKKFSIGLFIISLALACIQVDFFGFLYNQINKSNLYEEYYVPYNKENITFSDKRNLIYIYVESLENSNFSKNNGGIYKKSLMPNLEELASNNINFSNTDKLGGFRNIHGTNWTIAGMVAQTAGIPIYIKTTNGEDKFLEGATSLGDILLENEYKNYLMIGSDSNFGERKKYFTEHGNYEIFDYEYAKKYGYIGYDYFEWWGYEDRKLFEFAKSKLIDISNNNQPFNFTLLTADTHFFDGYVDKQCNGKFDDHYKNSFYCEDIMLVDFINWVMKQDFYNNTTIVITGDHLAMRNDFYVTSNGYERTVFNMFINPINSTDNTKNRSFTAFDIFPTTLSSIGGNIEGDRIALGTNLFSNKKTLSEELGYKKFYKETQKRSNYFNKYILKK